MFPEILRRELGAHGIVISDTQVDALYSHFKLLRRWNAVINLTRIIDVEEAVVFHYCESMFLAANLPSAPLRILDLGSGAGFPGIPIAVYRSDCVVSLVESHKRKSTFLREATRSLENVEVLGQRAQDTIGMFDWVVMRAVNFAEVEGFLKNLAPNVAFLGGADIPTHGFTWNTIQSPWGKNRFLWLGRST